MAQGSKNRTPLHNTAGSVMIEVSALASLLCLVALGVFDIGRVLHQYLILTRAVHEGVRTASSTIDLEVDDPNGANNIAVQERINTLLELYVNTNQVGAGGVSTIWSSGFDITTLHDGTTGTVAVTISGVFHGHLIPQLPFQVTGHGPYLY